MNKGFKQNISDNKFVYLLIFTEVILTYIACSGTLYMSMNIVNKAILSFGLLLIYLSNYLLLLNNKNKLIIRNALTVAAFTILTVIDIIYFDMSDKYFYELFSAQLLMVFFVEDAVISLLSKKLFFNESIKIYFFIAWSIASILTYFKIVSGIKLLIILMPIVYSYPLIFFIIT
ncbi:histidine kinase [Peptostreptococcus anaerobius]|uniref:histidine kinase n=1 Tax=Peptostreptococcus anaerobius TaxID=1261 RepID=UPI001D08159A|nr:histidine kinase [Peptostreptococcus anaerobius]MCB6982000.1 histidine kinase [Peptostreptococcus anaerobius]MCQ5150003.1 histidine kinase [Peptostreptococcus anaerobius]